MRRAHLQRQVGVLPLLPHLQAGQVGEPQLQLVLLLEVLHNTAVVCVTGLHGEGKSGEGGGGGGGGGRGGGGGEGRERGRGGGEKGGGRRRRRKRRKGESESGVREGKRETDIRLGRGWSSGDITHAILPLHRPSVSHLHLQTCDMVRGEGGSGRVSSRYPLYMYMYMCTCIIAEDHMIVT